jgi:hypothetical protein
LPAIFLTLKRGANERCAYGAIGMGASLVNKMDSAIALESGSCGSAMNCVQVHPEGAS